MRRESATLPPNPHLVAILLVVRSRTGPRLVFHYPPIPSTSSPSNSRDLNGYGTPGNQTDENDASDSGWSSGSGDAGGTDDDDDDVSRSSSKVWSRGSRLSGSRTGSRKDTVGSLRSVKTKSTPGSHREELDEEELEPDRGDDGDGLGQDEAKDGERNPQDKNEAEWERLLGFSADALGMLLSPSRIFHKRRFEISIEQLVFVGAPMFIRENGLWKKKRRKNRSVLGAAGADDISEQDDTTRLRDDAPKSTGQAAESKLAEPYVLSMNDLEQVPGFESAYGHGLVSGAASDVASETKSASSIDSDMTMFNVVFVLNPPTLEHHIRVEEMYDHVVKYFAKALKFQQAQREYVAKESRLISAMKDKAKDTKVPIHSLWPHILSQSALAKAIAITFDQISNNQIAHINISHGVDASFQIPQAISTPYIPTPSDPQIPGLWLTTATLSLDDEDDADKMLSPHSALLLLQDEEALLKDVESGGKKELSGPLSYFIRNLTPTKSLQKLSEMNKMSLKDVQFLARHLIYWRRARSIPPLRKGDIYIVSPNADMRALETARSAFALRFPTLPSLNKFLHLLSGPSRPYSMMMPSKDHRSAYMSILAWLMRGGWVTQLRTFGWVKVPPEVKAAVADKINNEANIAQRNGSSNGNVSSGDGTTEVRLRPTSSHSAEKSPMGREIDVSDALFTHSSSASAFLFTAKPPSESGSASSGQTAIPRLVRPFSPLQRSESTSLHRPSPLHINQSASPSSDEQSSLSSHSRAAPKSSTNGLATVSMSVDSADYDASLVDSPQKADALQSRWIEHIGSTFEDLDLKQMWPVLLTYFDGRHALEEISVREKRKKSEVGALLKMLTEGGWLITVRHW